MSDDLARALGAQDVRRVVQLYSEAADAKERNGEIDAACFLLTHAWVYALEADDPQAEALRGRLVAHGRERPE